MGGKLYSLAFVVGEVYGANPREGGGLYGADPGEGG